MDGLDEFVKSITMTREEGRLETATPGRGYWFHSDREKISHAVIKVQLCRNHGPRILGFSIWLVLPQL